jgi:hypothetical protein
MTKEIKLPPPRTAQLGYVSAREIEGPRGSLAGTVLRGRGGDAIGILDGILIEPSARRIAFLVVQTFHGGAACQYLLPVHAVLPRMEAARHALYVDIDEDEMVEYHRLAHHGFPDLSHADLISALRQEPVTRDWIAHCGIGTFC